MKRPRGAAASAERKKYALLLMVDGGDAEYRRLEATCEAACDAAVHAACKQLPGTLHLTLGEAIALTEATASAVRFGGKPPLPQTAVPIQLAGFKSWPRCLAVAVGPEAASAVNSLLARVEGWPGGPVVTEDGLHLSLYRGRGHGRELEQQIAFMVRAVGRSPFGTVRGCELAVKAVGGPYEERRVIWSA